MLGTINYFKHRYNKYNRGFQHNNSRNDLIYNQPSFKDHLISPVFRLTACMVPSNVETKRKDSGTLKVLG